MSKPKIGLGDAALKSALDRGVASPYSRSSEARYNPAPNLDYIKNFEQLIRISRPQPRTRAGLRKSIRKMFRFAWIKNFWKKLLDKHAPEY